MPGRRQALQVEPARGEVALLLSLGRSIGVTVAGALKSWVMD
jgi:hypothetical protein